MGWSADFLDALHSQHTVIKLHLEFAAPAVISAAHGGSYHVSSHDSDYPMRLGVAGVSTTSSQVAPGSWSVTHGAWSVTIVGSITGLLDNVKLGQMAVLYAGWEGWSTEHFEPIALGVLDNITGSNPEWALQFSDLLTGLGTRMTNSISNQLSLFRSVSATDTVAVTAYTAGDSTIRVASTAGFEQETGGSGLLAVTPISGDPSFYLKYTSSSVTTFSGVSTGNEMGTDRADAAIGSLVEEVGKVEGHPMTILRNVLQSTGAGSNGAKDTLPLTWGYAIPEEWVDDDDVDLWLAVCATGGGLYSWEVAIHDMQSSGIAWLTSLLGGAAIWPVIRQGYLSARCAQNPFQASTARSGTYEHSGITITDADLSATTPIVYHARHPGQRSETIEVQVHYNNGGGSGNEASYSVTGLVDSLPATRRVEHDLLDRLFISGSSAAQNMARDVARRVGYWELSISEGLTVSCEGLRMAQLVAGDLVDITTDQVQGRHSHTRAGYDGVVAMVTRVTTYWMEGRTELELAIPHSDGWDGILV